MSAEASLQRYKILSCALCQQRKVKCDRQNPCSNCVKANAPCVPSTPAPARPRRRPNQALKQRLAHCEDLLLQYSRGGLPPSGTGGQSATPFLIKGSTSSVAQSIDGDEQPQTPRPPGKIVHHDNGPRFMDSPILASIYDELVSMQELVEPIHDVGLATGAANSEILLCGDDPTVDLESLRPDAAHVFQLWQLFLDRVNPLGKIVHVPTVQPLIVESTTGISHMPMQHQALIFAIYSIAMISTSNDESLTMFNMSRDEALSRFMFGAKMALIRFDFLHNYDMAALQALILFLWSVPGRCDRSRAWVLSGVVVRIAQKAGYHRDGEQLGLTPFETEMRRRIWWQIFVQDSTYAMASGLGPSLMPANWDTKEPLNLNDADLYLNATSISPRGGPTEMAFCLILHRIYKLSTRIEGISGLGDAVLAQQGRERATLDRFRSAVAEMDKNVKALEARYVDSKAGNSHIAALTMRPMLMKKLAGMVPEAGAEDAVFRTLLATLEHECECYEQMAACRFEWAMKLHFQPDLLAAFVLQLAKRSDELADRGWAVVERMYAHQPELFDMTQRQHLAQARNTLGTWESRVTVETPAFIMRLRDGIAQADNASMFQEQDIMHTMFGGYDAHILDWANWEHI